MKEINLLRSLPKSKRDLSQRILNRDKNVIAISKEFGQMYFDGPRDYGYGGYKYDGRWRNVAKDLIEEYSLSSGMRVLDIGCAKGFLLKDLMIECPGLECFGIDISEYAIKNCEPEVKDRLQLGTAKSLPFANDSFELVISINTIHNLERAEAKQALSEIQRVSKSNSYVVVDSFNTPEEKEIFEKWVLTAKFYGYPSDWLTLFEEAGYTGDYSWTIIN
jgi:ubiquinone/menaquinone biosynthesis C-methylase UbiE